MKNLTPEMIEQAKAAKSAEELLAIAKENGVDVTADEAKTYFEQLNPKSGELGDEELDSVAGGACSGSDFQSASPVQEGTRVRVINGKTCSKCGGTTGTYTVDADCKIITRVLCDCGRRNICKKAPGYLELGIDVEII